MPEKINSKYDAWDSPRSVGWIRSERARLADAETPFELEAGGQLKEVDVEYETYGVLSEAKDNVILVAHPLSADAHAAGWDASAVAENRSFRAERPGWWDAVIGPGKALDTNTYFVICSNVLGSCYGTTSPASVDPDTGKAYGLDFPIVTIGDWVRLQARLLDYLGIDTVHAVVGGSLGGQQALEWAMAYPERVKKCVVLAASARLSAEGLGFNAVGRFTIMKDQHFHDGAYYDYPDSPADGLAAARMLAHITYLSEDAMHAKFGRRLRGKARPDFGFGIEFEVESYLSYQGSQFINRFDANSYLYITRAMDYYDAADRGNGDLVKACAGVTADMLVVGFSSDWLYPPGEARELALALARNDRPVNYVEIESEYGHDAFLVETEKVSRLLTAFL
ncbi:MAG: homoserine O-acetyltransferase [Lentisphaeria bacterium]|nr:homoserine O-acetyltransferase [Lentisphaeria bacterium]